ncbi:MAG: T9SS type A sorting domain-containing protein [Flavobacteriales bacterium]|nr:T9SS type A sorting domain-containing protein [Flavobacteriales bacterium]
MRILILLIFSLISTHFAAQVATGEWRDHFPYGNAIDVCGGEDGIVYCAADAGVFAFDRRDGSIERITKVNKLSDTGISSIGYNRDVKVLVVGYTNGNVDLVYENNAVNMPDIERSSILANKTVNDIYFVGNEAFLSCGFGIVVVDLVEAEVKDTYIIGDLGNYVGINDLATDGSEWFAATDAGLYRAPLNHPFLANYETWEIDANYGSDTTVKYIEYAEGYYYLVLGDSEENELVWGTDGETWQTNSNFSGSSIRTIFAGMGRVMVGTYGTWFNFNYEFGEPVLWGEILGYQMLPNAMTIDNENSPWVANSTGGLVGHDKFVNKYQAMPDGPQDAKIRRLDAYNDNIWIATGGADGAWVSTWNGSGIHGLVHEQWINRGKFNDESMFDLMDVAIDPTNTDHVVFGSWVVGLVEVLDGEYYEVIDNTNSSLSLVDYGGIDRVAVGGVDFDLNGNLWFTNTVSNTPLHVRTKSGTYQSFDFSPEVTESTMITEVRATQQGYVWCVLPNGKGLLVLDHKGTLTNTSDDQYIVLDNEEGNGGLPIDEVICIEEDLDGEVWVGLLQGLAVFYAPEAIFTGENFDAQQILIEQDGNVQILLETETVNCIEIDGANRKWVATANSGVFLLSADGIDQIHHFTEDNSPLPSNNVLDIAINHASGEVYFGTERGLVSFRSDATNFVEDMDNIKVYPNPVLPTYTGVISIDGLSRDADVKISDASGNVVFQTTAQGGRATWDGNNFYGNRVSSGVYFIHASTTDGESRGVGKVAFVK